MSRRFGDADACCSDREPYREAKGRAARRRLKKSLQDWIAKARKTVLEDDGEFDREAWAWDQTLPIEVWLILCVLDSDMSHTKDFFDEWASIYDIDYRDLEMGDVDFYLSLAEEIEGPVLEVGVGTGRIYLELLRNNIDVYGIDISSRMITVLEQKAREENLDPKVRQGDMAGFEPQRKYDLVIVPFRTFLHNLSLSDQKAALNRFRNALSSGGRLALNFFVPNFDSICDYYGEYSTRVIEHEGEEFELTDITELESQLDKVVRTTRKVKKAGELIHEGSFQITLISRREFELLLETTGWSDWSVYGGFNYEPLESAEQEMVWIVEN